MASLGLPVPTAIEFLKVRADYHSIYLLRYGRGSARFVPAQADPDGAVTLVLRVSGRHLPYVPCSARRLSCSQTGNSRSSLFRPSLKYADLLDRYVKTMNEVGAMTWIRQHTTIPVPSILHFSASDENPIGHEFTLMERARGTSIDTIYDSLSEDNKEKIVEQLANFVIELHSKPFPPRVGGLVLEGGSINPGPALEETFWQAPDIETYCPGETIESLNPLGSFDSYVYYSTAALECYCHMIEAHPALEDHRDMLPRIREFISAIGIEPYKSQLNNTKYVMAHKDLHFANIMCDPSDMSITAILDWEFSGVVPASRWNPVRAFLWNGKRGEEARAEKLRLEEMFGTICAEKGAANLLEDMKPNESQERMQTAINHIRAIVEVCPRGQAQDKVGAWRATAEAAMRSFTPEI